MSDPFFFGYGSLVNRKTHDYGQTRPATVHGWRRQWRHTTLRQVAYLTVTKAPGQMIDGLIAAVPNGDWAALDRREHAYARLHLETGQIDHDHPQKIEVQIYKTKPAHDAPPSTRHPILQSYLDTVLLGYLDVFGQEGAKAFFASTDGWDAPILDDRENPIYPRAVKPAKPERLFIDAQLDALNVTRS